MMVKPCASAIAAIPGKPTPSPSTAAAPAPMKTNEKVPMNSARSLGAIRLDIVDSTEEVDRSTRTGLRQEQFVRGGRRRGEERPPAGEASARHSAAVVCGAKLIPSASATPAPYSGSAL